MMEHIPQQVIHVFLKYRSMERPQTANALVFEVMRCIDWNNIT